MKESQDLAVFEPFGQLSAPARQLLSQRLVRKGYRQHETVLHRGQPASGAYVVLAGALRVFTVAPNGTEATLYRVEPGQTCVLSLNCLFNDLLYPAWVQAESASRVGVIPGAVYRELFSAERAIQDLTVHALSTLVYRLMAELESIHACSHRQRLAHHLLLHANGEGELHATQQELAGHLGTTREVVARLMQELAGGGYVQTRRGMVTIKDLFGLRRLLSPVQRHDR